MKTPESTLIFRGQSMRPLLKDGDQLTVQYFPRPRALETLALGQVVLLREGSEWVVHRVVEVDALRKTKGDWSMSFDEDSLVWGEVIQKNGQESPGLQSRDLAALSAKIRADTSRWARRLARLRLYLMSWRG